MGHIQSSFCEHTQNNVVRPDREDTSLPTMDVSSQPALDAPNAPSAPSMNENKTQKQLENEQAADMEHKNENEEEEEESKYKNIELRTAPIDPRFPSPNASRYCFTLYNEYHKCIQERSDDDSECRLKAKNYRSVCPVEWILYWNQLREEGTWFGKY